MTRSSKVQIIKPKFLHIGDVDCIPIPRDYLTILSPNFGKIKAKIFGETWFCWRAPKVVNMLVGGQNMKDFTHIYIPFSISTAIKGAYICLSSLTSPPSHLIFSFTSSKKERIFKRYEFPELKRDCYWFFLSIDLLDVVLCKIEGKTREDEPYVIRSLCFVREETPHEANDRISREKLWSDALTVESMFVKEGDLMSKGRDSVPIPRLDPKVINPAFLMVSGTKKIFSKESIHYDQSLDAHKMLKGEGFVELSHISIPFPFPSDLQGAY
ncbi:hypothetical protein ADUPG1_010108, partial [Aduncisulcus paluster]